MSIELDIRKAYDRVQWDNLQQIMLTIDLDAKMVELIMGWVMSPTFSVLINGIPKAKSF